MAYRGATTAQAKADELDRRLFDYAEHAYSMAKETRDKRWLEVSAALDKARTALLPLMHPEDRKIAANA